MRFQWVSCENRWQRQCKPSVLGSLEEGQNQNKSQVSENVLENFLEQEGRFKLGASITRFAIDPEASDEKRAALKRGNGYRKIKPDQQKKRVRGASISGNKRSNRGWKRSKR
jgi:hypothetical protein